MTTKIDDKSVIPLSWVISGFTAGLVPVVAATIWVSTVNYRLQRIEEKLGIPKYTVTASFTQDANAGEQNHANRPERVFKSLEKLPACD